MSDVIIDSNIFILYVVGEINPHLIATHKRTSIFNESHFNYLKEILAKFDRLLICPNIATEVDNLLNNFQRDYHFEYLSITRNIYKYSHEKYIETCLAMDSPYYESIGITDSVILHMAKECDLLISGDSELCDFART